MMKGKKTTREKNTRHYPHDLRRGSQYKQTFLPYTAIKKSHSATVHATRTLPTEGLIGLRHRWVGRVYCHSWGTRPLQGDRTVVGCKRITFFLFLSSWSSLCGGSLARVRWGVIFCLAGLAQLVNNVSLGDKIVLGC